ncbi:MAG TPA: class III signal peptide-containing protein [Methanothermococcus okinawensis]|uniref:Class III signal peptide-containing protein n=1 Tax=Methanothermococcus okinawensis TaxID=155863 RepID=A0A832ZS90_9EURY|nr:class III signal peptide-containing protein [Methanococcaceae archaeon]HIP84347.1 class III signal peptide-containing protein [Methanothermococcus okinawensis]HIP91508.1 class III signal peptide-containing protein [Methanothermococcus okinawensis]
MKGYRGQISLELTILILAVVLAAVIVGVILLDNVVNTSVVQDTREVIHRGFVRE